MQNLLLIGNIKNTIMQQQIFKNDAKQIVDLMFNTKLFNDDVTRDTMNEFEELITFLLQSRFDSYVKIDSLLKKLPK